MLYPSEYSHVRNIKLLPLLFIQPLYMLLKGNSSNENNKRITQWNDWYQGHIQFWQVDFCRLASNAFQNPSCCCISANTRPSSWFSFLNASRFQQSFFPLSYSQQLLWYIKITSRLSYSLTIIIIRYWPSCNSSALLWCLIIVIWKIVFPMVMSYFL